MTQNREPDVDRWPPQSAIATPDWVMPGWGTTIWRGICGRCPHCGKAAIFNGYLKVQPVCMACGAPLGEVPADDAPPYIAMVVVLQILALFVVLFYKGYFAPGIIASSVLLVLLALVCMAALRLAKGAVIGILLKVGLKREVLNG